MGAEGAIPVWGIEIGDGHIRAIRLSRRADGGFHVLDYREEEVEVTGPEALVGFLKRRGLRRHPVAIAVQSPSAHFRSVAISPDDLARPRDDLAATLAEYVHPEPEDLELKWMLVGEDRYLVSAEERARVESYLIALESAQVPAWSFSTGIEALHGGVRRSGLLDGDAIVIRVNRSSTDVLFLDGDDAARQSLPVGLADLEDEETRKVFVEDVGRLLEYHRTKFLREEAERYVLLGLPDGLREKVAALLPEPPIAFPEDATPVLGSGRVGLMKALDCCGRAPAAVGVAFGAVSAPRCEDLALRPLPDVLPTPPRPALAYYVAALLLLLAVGVAWLGITRDVERLRAAADRPLPESPRIPAATVARLENLACAAGLRAVLPEALGTTLSALPGAESAPWRPEILTFRALESGAYAVTLSLRLPAIGTEVALTRVAAAAERIRSATGADVVTREDGSDVILDVRFDRGEEP